MRILYIHSCSAIGGGNKVLLGLLAGLDRSRFLPVSVIPEPGPMEQELRRLDVPYFILDLRPNPRTRASLGRTLALLAMRCLRHRVGILHANDPLTYRLASLGVAPAGAMRVCTVHHPGQT